MKSVAKYALGFLGLGICTSLLAFQAAPAIPNMVLYYKFDETVGNIAFDSSDSGLDGNWTITANSNATITPSADVGMAPAVPGNVQSLLFGMPSAVNTNGAFIDVPNSAALSFTGPFSAMAWIKPTTLVTGQNNSDRGSIVQKWDYGNQQLSGWSFERYRDGRIIFYTGNRAAAGTDTLITTTTATPIIGVVPDNTWHHVAVVYTGPVAAPTPNKFIYIDGTVRASKNTPIVPVTSPQNLHVAKDDYNRNFYGNIDEVRLFDGALTAAQVMQCYNGVHAPLNVVATAGPDEAVLTWTASATADNYDIYRSINAPGGPYGWLANVTPGATTTYVDQTATNGSTYYYVIKSRVGTLASAYSNEASCIPFPARIIINPKAVSVAEAGGTATFTVTLLVRPNNTSVTVRVTSSIPADVGVSGPAGGAPAAFVDLVFLANQPLTQTVTVTGIERYVQGPDIIVPLTFTVTSTDPYYFAGTAPRPVPCTVIQDRPGLVINPPSGLATTNGGPAITFTVGLATQTIGAANFTFSVSDPNLATVTAAPLTLTTVGPTILVTVTPIAFDPATTSAAPYTININSSTSSDPGYAALGITRVPIFTESTNPPLEHLWKCGLLGIDGLLPLGLLALWRRRRQARSSR